MIFSPNPDSLAAYRGNDHLEKPPPPGRVNTRRVQRLQGYHQKNRQAGHVTTLHVHSKRFQENVLDGTKREYYDTWFRENVLDGTKSWSQ